MAPKEFAIVGYKGAEMMARGIATFTALVAALAFLWPWLGGQLNLLTAQRFGVEGHVFYEVAPDPSKVPCDENAEKHDCASNKNAYSITESGDFYAPQSLNKSFEGIQRGAILQAASDAYLHALGRTGSTVTYKLRGGDCVLVLDRGNAAPADPRYSGGWLHVVTAACGLFR